MCSELSGADPGAALEPQLLVQCKSSTGDSTGNLFIKQTLKF